jgi:hypothetical protein
MAQSRTMSVVETVVQNGVGFIIAVAMQAWLLPFFGFSPSLSENIQITLAFMFVSALRGYLFRRLFEYLEARQKDRRRAPTPASLMAMMAMSQDEAEFWSSPHWTDEQLARITSKSWDNSEREALENNEVFVRMGQR